LIDRVRRVLHAAGGATGASITLGREESSHLCRVLRLSVGARLAVFDGAGREWEAVLETADPAAAVVSLGPEIARPVEPVLPVTIFQGLCRPERVEWVLQKGTEVGVSRFVLFRAGRSEGPDPSPARFARWEKILAEACRQSGRRAVPRLEGPVAAPTPPPAGALGLFLDPSGPPLASLLDGLPGGPVAIAVGPEGGFETDERGEWTSIGWKPAGLGPRVLRTETAGVVAASIVLHRFGDLGRVPCGG
jgi:16S rRNA (uracil1498-N3)-methyltransferase